MTPNQQAHIQTLMANGKAAHARELLKRLIKDKNDQDAAGMLAEMDEMYPETRLEKANEASKRILLYLALGIVALVLIVFTIGIVQFMQAQTSL